VQQGVLESTTVDQAAGHVRYFGGLASDLLAKDLVDSHVRWVPRADVERLAAQDPVARVEHDDQGLPVQVAHLCHQKLRQIGG
jgi:hypothetical protein